MIVSLAFACVLSAAADGDSLHSAVTARIAAEPAAAVGVAMIDLESGDTLFLSADTVFHAASTMKVPVMMELFRQTEQGAFTLDQGLLLVNQFRSIGDGSPFSVDSARDSDSALYRRIGTRVSVRELLERMVTRSSNLATNAVISLVGATEVTATVRRLGGKHTQVLRGVEDMKAFDRKMNNVTTARDLAIVMRAIHQGAPGVLRAHDEMRRILFAQEFKEKIPAGLPNGTPVANKTGEITANSHDAAIIYPPGRKPYVLVVMTRGIRDAKISAALIADISRIVHASVTRRAR